MTYTETFESIRYTADIVVVTPDRHVLLIERDWEPYAGHWALPGGHVDPEETSRDAAARELAEETGVRVTPQALLQLGTWDQPGRDPRGRYVTVAYLVTVPTGTPIAAGDDARTAQWWPLDTLPERLAFDHADIIGAAPQMPELRIPADDFQIGDLVHTEKDGIVEVRDIERGKKGDLTVNPGEPDELNGKVWEHATVTRPAGSEKS